MPLRLVMIGGAATGTVVITVVGVTTHATMLVPVSILEPLIAEVVGAAVAIWSMCAGAVVIFVQTYIVGMPTKVVCVTPRAGLSAVVVRIVVVVAIAATIVGRTIHSGAIPIRIMSVGTGR